MTLSAKIIEDSISPAGKRLTTVQLRYPRFIHAEAKTHRIVSQSDEEMVVLTQNEALMCDPNLSRNASSSRAIPVAKMVERTLADPAYFVEVGKNQAGMQARELVSPEIERKFKREWMDLMRVVAGYTMRWGSPVEQGGYGIHKQVANRALEAWQHIEVVVTATEWDNFYALRNHPDAQPEIRELAKLMLAAMDVSTPTLRGYDERESANWHLPYVLQAERNLHPLNPRYLAELSTARNARVSFLTHDGQNPVVAKDLKLFSDLVGAEPLHASPTEHIGHPLAEHLEQRSGNFDGWFQFRKQVEADIARAA